MFPMADALWFKVNLFSHSSYILLPKGEKNEVEQAYIDTVHPYS